ncbi:MAG: SRPBCC domain-containing protein [Paracoccaceae bacterium]|nr:SRPBCC domain-containing protein [Paracoccaceae bacterium]MDE2911468.1 SRPBCC domain-containing protein [Paracoccaceae bacterium]
MSELPTYVLEREFDAPRHRVWKAWTDKDMLSHWYGPGVETVIHRLDVRPGGQWLVEMRWGESANFQRSDYTDVVDGERLCWLQSVTDENWNVTANPMMPDWPRVLASSVILTEDDGKTTMQFTWVPHEASEAEIACFAQAAGGMDKGWQAGMNLMKELVESSSGDE